MAIESIVPVQDVPVYRPKTAQEFVMLLDQLTDKESGVCQVISLPGEMFSESTDSECRAVLQCYRREGNPDLEYAEACRFISVRPVGCSYTVGASPVADPDPKCMALETRRIEHLSGRN